MQVNQLNNSNQMMDHHSMFPIAIFVFLYNQICSKVHNLERIYQLDLHHIVEEIQKLLFEIKQDMDYVIHHHIYHLQLLSNKVHILHNLNDLCIKKITLHPSFESQVNRSLKNFFKVCNSFFICIIKHTALIEVYTKIPK